MATDLLLPQWGFEMQAATITRWLKHEGDSVQEGEPLVEVETDKMSTELEAPATGVLARILVEEASIVPIRTRLAVIAQPGEDITAFLAAPPAFAAPSMSLTGAAPARPGAPGAAGPRSAGREREVVPAARQLAREHGIDLDKVEGSGPNGRVLAADVQAALSRTAAAPGEVPFSGARRTIATRMRDSLQTTAQLTLTTEVDVTEAMRLRDGVRGSDAGVSPLHLMVTATARALREHPRMNAHQGEDGYRPIDEVNIGIAVAVPDGLLVPVLWNADKKDLLQIAREAAGLVERVREGKSTPQDMTGGTFTITNLGPYKIDAFTPILNPPEAGILGVGRAVEKPAVREGQIVARKMAVLSLTFDHRVIDGAPAAEFLATISGYLEDPRWMFPSGA